MLTLQRSSVHTFSKCNYHVLKPGMPEPLNIQQINKTEKNDHLVLHRDSLTARVSVGLARFSVVVQSVLWCSIFCCFCLLYSVKGSFVWF